MSRIEDLVCLFASTIFFQPVFGSIFLKKSMLFRDNFLYNLNNLSKNLVNSDFGPACLIDSEKNTACMFNQVYMLREHSHMKSDF